MATKPVTKEEIENFAVKLTNDCETHEAWLAVVRYGLGTLLENQSLFIEIIVREAEKMTDMPGKTSDRVRFIFEELGLRFVIA
jgi:hypothetical protein